jgi:hypothetical protein
MPGWMHGMPCCQHGRNPFVLLLTLRLSFSFLPILGRSPAFIIGGELRLLSQPDEILMFVCNNMI